MEPVEHDDPSASVREAHHGSLPPRPDPIPLPPRKNASGLPPSYELHFKRLLAQFIAQQVRPAVDGLPGSPAKPKDGAASPLWTEQAGQGLAQTLWDDLVQPHGRDGRVGLLSLDWGRWVIEGRKRRARLRDRPQAVGSSPITAPTSTTAPEEPHKTARRPSITPPNALDIYTAPAATPQKTPTRPSSAASSLSMSEERQNRLSESPVVITKGLSGSPQEQHHLEEMVSRERLGYLKLLRGLRGYAPMTERPADEWEMLNGPSTVHRWRRAQKLTLA